MLRSTVGLLTAQFDLCDDALGVQVVPQGRTVLHGGQTHQGVCLGQREVLAHDSGGGGDDDATAMVGLQKRRQVFQNKLTKGLLVPYTHTGVMSCISVTHLFFKSISPARCTVKQFLKCVCVGGQDQLQTPSASSASSFNILTSWSTSDRQRATPHSPAWLTRLLKWSGQVRSG